MTTTESNRQTIWEWGHGVQDGRRSYLKKSFLQKSLFSLVKHLSVRTVRQSKHLTHAECQDLSKTFTRNRSSIALSQAAHVIIMMIPWHLSLQNDDHFKKLSHTHTPLLFIFVLELFLLLFYRLPPLLSTCYCRPRSSSCFVDLVIILTLESLTEDGKKGRRQSMMAFVLNI